MAKWVALTARKLKPGSYEWRQAWETGETPEGVKAYICRNVKDPDEIIAFGIVEASKEEMEALSGRGVGRLRAPGRDGASHRVGRHRRLLRGHRRSPF